MATFGSDSFTGTSGTLLSAHTPEAGGSWVIATGTTNTLQIDATGRCTSTSASNEGDYLNQGTPASADYDVGADLWSGSSSQTNYAGVFGRADASAGNSGTTGKAYLAQYDHTAGAWSIQKGVNAVYTVIGTNFTATLTGSTTTTFLLSMRGTAISLTVAGTVRVSGTNTETPSFGTGKAGVFVSSGIATGGGSLELDNFLAADPVAASTFPPVPALYYKPILAM